MLGVSSRPLLSAAMALCVAVLSGCAERTVVPTGAPGGFLQNISTSAIAPPCKNQKTTARYADVTQRLVGKGGSACIPAFDAYGGDMNYPGARPPVRLSLTSSTSNYNHRIPTLGKGQPILYLQLGISGGTTFASTVHAGGGLTGKHILPGKIYSAFGQATIAGIPLNFTPCYIKANKGPFGGVLDGVGILLKGKSVPVAATGVLEIYSGQQASEKC